MPTRGVKLIIIMMIHLSFITPVSYLLSLWVFIGTYDDHCVTNGNYLDPVLRHYCAVCINGRHHT